MRNSDDALHEAASIAVLLAGGSFLSLFVAGIGSLVLARLLGPEGYGTYSLVLAIPAFLMSFVDLGMSASVIRYVAKYPDRAVRYISQSFFVVALAASAITVVGVATSSFLSRVLINRPEYSELVVIALPYLIAYSIFNINRASLMGLGEKVRTALLEPLYNSLRVSLSIALVVTMFVRGAILGVVIASIVSCLISLLILLRSLSKLEFEYSFTELRELLGFSLPLYITGLIGSTTQMYTTLTLSTHFTDFEIGSYRAALNLLAVISLVISPFSTAFLKVFSEAEVRDLEKLLIDSVNYIVLFSIPLTLFSSVTSHDIVRVVYGRRYMVTENYFSIVVLTNMLTLAGSHVLGPALSAVNRTKYILLSNIVGTLIYIPLLYILVRALGLYGVALSQITLSAIITLTQLYFLKKVVKVSLNISYSVKVLASSTAPTILVAYLTRGTDFLDSLTLLIAKFTIFIAIYIALLVVLRAISENDIIKLFSLSRSLGPLSKLVDIALKYAALLVKLLQDGE
ncbi:MAG: oligosaccharide flippase family protein [Sulfolobales archaeon]|nr:oligosaccharide flippase family protein [Sulfolobales archaeon]MDW8083374.1 oligosaccharide flippase family protein [Sulfolobales archaeon]